MTSKADSLTRLETRLRQSGYTNSGKLIDSSNLDGDHRLIVIAVIRCQGRSVLPDLVKLCRISSIFPFILELIKNGSTNFQLFKEPVIVEVTKMRETRCEKVEYVLRIAFSIILLLHLDIQQQQYHSITISSSILSSTV